MDTDPSRRYDQASFNPARGFVPNNGRGSSGTGGPDRFRQAHVQMPPTPTSAVGPSNPAAGSRAAGSYTYTQGQPSYAPQMQDGAQIQYRPGTEYSQDAAQRQSQQQQPQQHSQTTSQQPHQQQQFPTYSSNMIYNMPSQIQQQPADYDVQQFQPRQSAAIEVLSNQFNVPQQYYNPAADTATAAASTQQPQSYASGSFPPQSSYASGSQNRSSSSPYAAGITDYSAMNMSSVLDDPVGAPVQPGSSSAAGRRSSHGDAAFAGYMESLKQTFKDIQYGRLLEAGGRLLQLSEWLTREASDLGLTRDEPGLHEERLKFWMDFNTCWLAVLQRQKDMTQGMFDGEQSLRSGENIMQEDMLERMGRELVRMCDLLEKNGLVDYQMGVWEEEIMNVLLECINLLESDPEEPSSARIPDTRHALHRPSR